MANILSRIKYICEKKMETQEISKDNKDEGYSYVLGSIKASISSKYYYFEEDFYRDKLRDIRIYLSTIRK